MPAFAQESAETYVWETDPAVAAKLEQWRDLKFGFFMHWGLYSQLGIIESWSLCPEDWITRDGMGAENYFAYKTNYENVITQFNPTGFRSRKVGRRNEGCWHEVRGLYHEAPRWLLHVRYKDHGLQDHVTTQSVQHTPPVECRERGLQAFIVVSIFCVHQAQSQLIFTRASEGVTVTQQTSIEKVGPDTKALNHHGSTAVSEDLPALLQEAASGNGASSASAEMGMVFVPIIPA